MRVVAGKATRRAQAALGGAIGHEPRGTDG